MADIMHLATAITSIIDGPYSVRIWTFRGLSIVDLLEWTLDYQVHSENTLGSTVNKVSGLGISISNLPSTQLSVAIRVLFLISSV